MDTKSLLENYLGKKTRTTEKDMGNGSKQVCDLDSGDCRFKSYRPDQLNTLTSTLGS